MIFKSILKQDYDHRVSVEKQNVLCYSKKKMKALHPNGDFRVVGEAHSIRAAKKVAEGKKAPIGEYALNESKSLGVFAEGSKSRLFYKKAGYVSVGDGAYLVILTSRVPFLASLLGTLAVFAVILGILLSGGEGGIFTPPVVPPINPLPPEDENSAPIEGDDNEEKLESEAGGGAVSLIYTTDATLNLSTTKIKMYFLNPRRSNHDIVFHLTLLNGEERIRIASSGRIVPGKGLLIMEFDTRSAQLSEGVYEGLYEVYFYNSETGERAAVSSDVAGIKITVVNE